MALAIGSVSIPVFEVTGVDGSDVLIVPSLPTDGSLGLAFLECDPSAGEWQGGMDRHLIAFIGGGSGNTMNYDPTGAPPMVSAYAPNGWAFVI